MQKAASIQQARDAQGAMKFANKYLPCIARLSFRLGKGLPPKFKKSLSESNATRIDDVMQRLNLATKQLQRVLQSNGEKGIEEQEIVDACEKGEELCGSLSEFVVL